MGSFAAPVDLPEQLRPFAQAGLALLYVPGGLAAEDLAHATTAAPSAGLPGATAQDHMEQSGPAEASPPVNAAAETLAPEIWPEPWRALYARVRITPRVIITYASLADDMAGNADPARRRLLQNMLAYLAWPPGTTLFWPISFPIDAAPGQLFATDIFAAGVAHFNIRHIVCLGAHPAERARTLYPQEGQTPPVLVHAAPEPGELVTLLPHELHKALEHIKSIKLA